MNSSDWFVRVERSTFVRAVLGAAAIIASVFAAVWVSGFIQLFAANRGFLQLVIVIPVVSLLTGGLLALARVVTLGQMLWGMALLEAIILIGTGVLGPGYRAWPWAVVMSGAVVIPAIVGLLAGTAIGKRRRVAARDE